MNETSIRETLVALNIPELNMTLADTKSVKGVVIEGNKVSIQLSFGFPVRTLENTIKEQVLNALNNAFPDLDFSVSIKINVAAHVTKAGVQGIPGVKNIIAVASGKGGVGKSTTSVNLALALAAEGASVGLLDADIYGPSVPIMIGAEGSQPESRDQKSVQPIKAHGIQAMSIGFLVEPDQAMVWRGPMASQALQQIIRDTRWADLDYLIVDLPPGTGDIQLTLAQKIPVTASVIVTTPQDLALADARKAVAMFEKVSVPVLGVVENMAMHVCTKCGHEEHIFGTGGGQTLAEKYNVELLGSLPLAMSIREQVDSGNPTVAADIECSEAQSYLKIARKIGSKLALSAKDYSKSFPNISIAND